MSDVPHRYQEIAELAVRWMRAQAGQPVAARVAARPGGPLLDQMAQELYRVVLFGVFYAQVSALAYIPYIGPLPCCLLTVIFSPDSDGHLIWPVLHFMLLIMGDACL
jgi:hypothetical protein